MQKTATNHANKAAYSIALLTALLGAFFLGFYACGVDAHAQSIAGLFVLIAICIAVVTRWRLSINSASTQPSQLRYIIGIVTFTAVLLVCCLIANAFGWLVYYSPTSVDAAYREFKSGLIGERCG